MVPTENRVKEAMAKLSCGCAGPTGATAGRCSAGGAAASRTSFKHKNEVFSKLAKAFAQHHGHFLLITQGQTIRGLEGAPTRAAVLDGARGLPEVPVTRARPPIMRAPSSREAPPPSPAHGRLGFCTGESGSPKRPCHRVSGLLCTPSLG